MKATGKRYQVLQGEFTMGEIDEIEKLKGKDVGPVTAMVYVWLKNHADVEDGEPWTLSKCRAIRSADINIVEEDDTDEDVATDLGNAPSSVSDTE